MLDNGWFVSETMDGSKGKQSAKLALLVGKPGGTKKVLIWNGEMCIMAAKSFELGSIQYRPASLVIQ
jgi:hypothetical protein